LQGTDLAVLEAGQKRDDLPCAVTEEKAFLGFDLRYHSGYDVTIPLRDLAGSENLLTILFRVTPEKDKENPRYFVQRIRVPSVEEEAKGDAYLQGAFDLGEGKYHVDWLMRDRTERVCAASWDLEVELPEKDRQVALMIPANTVEPYRFEQFHDDPPVQRSTDTAPLNVKILVNFAPQKASASALRPLDTIALVSMLRTLNQEPRIGKFSVVAFNLQDQNVVYRKNMADRIDFQALGESLETINPGTVELRHLAEKNSETVFLADLMAAEFKNIDYDGVIFAGPKALLEKNISGEQLKQLGELRFPLFYLNYILNPQAAPWRDVIGNAVKFFKGAEYTVSRPRDLWYAVTEIVSKIVKSRNEKQLASVSSQ
jgi:hypothetical protein